MEPLPSYLVGLQEPQIPTPTLPLARSLESVGSKKAPRMETPAAFRLRSISAVAIPVFIL